MSKEDRGSDDRWTDHAQEHDAVKTAMKEALKEWLDDKFSEFGKWSLGAIMAAALAALAYFILYTNGWKHP